MRPKHEAGANHWMAGTRHDSSHSDWCPRLVQASGTDPLGPELTIQLGLRNVTISHHEDWKHLCETISTLRLRYKVKVWLLYS